MQSKLSVFLDTLFLSVIAFFISYSTLKVFVDNNILCLCFALFVFIICWRLTFPKSIQSWNKKYTTKLEHKHMEKCIFALQTMENEQILAFFEQLFAKSFTVKRDENFLIIDNKLLVAFDYLSEKIEKRFVLEAYIKANKLQLEEIAIFTYTQTPDTVSYAKNLKDISIYFFDQADTYALMKECDTYISEKDETCKVKPFSNLKNISLSKKKA